MDNVDRFINLVLESINTKIISLPDDPKELFKKIKISFPNLLKEMQLVNASVIHNNIIKFKTPKINIFIKRSEEDYKKLDVLGKFSGKNLFYEKGVFFEDLERTIKTKMKMEVGVVAESGKIGTNTKDIEKFADTIESSVDAFSSDDKSAKSLVKNLGEKFEDFDKVINNSRFKNKVAPETYKKIKNSK